MSLMPDVLMPSSVESAPRSARSSATSTASQDESFASVYDAQSRPREAVVEKDASVEESALHSVADEQEGSDLEEQLSEELALLADNGNVLPEVVSEDSAPVVEFLQSPLWAWVNNQNQSAPSSLPGFEDSLNTSDALMHVQGQILSSLEMIVDPKVAKLTSAQTSQPLVQLTEISQKPELLMPELEAELIDAELLVETGVKLDALGAKALNSNEGQSDASRLMPLTQSAQMTQLQAARGPVLVPGQALGLQSGLSEAVIEKVMWMSSQNLQSAQIQLDPAELGRLDVRVSMQGDQAQVVFSSAHAAVRDALESQMQRLRELFAQQGMNQLDVSVSDRSAQEHKRESRFAAASSDAEFAEDNGVTSTTGLAETSQGTGLVDYYA